MSSRSSIQYTFPELLRKYRNNTRLNRLRYANLFSHARGRDRECLVTGDTVRKIEVAISCEDFTVAQFESIHKTVKSAVGKFIRRFFNSGDTINGEDFFMKNCLGSRVHRVLVYRTCTSATLADSINETIDGEVACLPANIDSLVAGGPEPLEEAVEVRILEYVEKFEKTFYFPEEVPHEWILREFFPPRGLRAGEVDGGVVLDRHKLELWAELEAIRDINGWTYDDICGLLQRVPGSSKYYPAIFSQFKKENKISPQKFREIRRWVDSLTKDSRTNLRSKSLKIRNKLTKIMESFDWAESSPANMRDSALRGVLGQLLSGLDSLKADCENALSE